MIIKMKKFAGYFLICFPVILTVIIWITSGSFMARFGNLSDIFLNLGRITGLLGLSFFAVSLYLSARIKIFNGFLTVGEICKAHHNLASIGFVLMLFHPLFLAIRYSVYSVVAAANFLLPFDNLINLAGFVALILLSYMTLATYWLTKNRFVWIWSHRLSLVAYILSGLHLLFVTSDTSSYPILKYWLLFLMTVGSVGFVYQRLMLSYFRKPQEEAC